MKKLAGIIIFYLIANTINAQNPGEWYKSNIENGLYGIELPKAQEFLKSKRVKKAPIIAIIGGGADIEHEVLKNSIWNNPKEIADGVDNDGNGYVDDINGWNFIGGKDGSIMEFTMNEGDREWLRLKDKYADIVFDGKQYFKYVDGVKTIISKVDNIEEYKYFFNLLLRRKTVMGPSYSGHVFSYVMKDYVNKWDEELKQMFPGKERNEISIEDFTTQIVKKKYPQKDSLRDVSLTFVNMYASMVSRMNNDSPNAKPFTWENVYNQYTNRQIDFSYKNYMDLYKMYGRDTRKQIVGDNHMDITDKKYGNNILLTPGLLGGTMVSGMINAIAPDSKLMHLVVLGQQGEPYLKDIALSITYAVDNGADIIMLPQQNNLYPPDQKKWVSDAINYAQNKGILVVVPVWEKSENLSINEYFPNPAMDKSRHLKNLMTVANSDENGNPSKISNYGAKELDTYAPGINIYSTSPGDLYKTGTSSIFGAAVTVGIAGLIKSYFPKLSGEVIKELIVANPTIRDDVEIEKSIVVNGENTATDLFLFEQLCRSKGIVNANNAVRAAALIK